MMFFLDLHKREKMTLQANSTRTPTGCASSSESIHPTSMIAGSWWVWSCSLDLPSAKYGWLSAKLIFRNRLSFIPFECIFKKKHSQGAWGCQLWPHGCHWPGGQIEMSIFWCASATQQSAMVSNFGFTLSDFLFVIVALWLYIFFFRSSAELGRSQVCLWRWQKQELMISNFTLFFCFKTQIPRYR